MSYQFENFVENYLSKINNIVFKRMDNDIEDKEFLEELTANRNKIPEILEEEGLDKDYLNNLQLQKQNRFKNQIIRQLKSKYDENILKGINTSDIVDTMFFNNTKIEEKEINEYGQNLLKYTTTKDINHLYDFNFLKIADNNDLSDNEHSLNFKEVLAHAVKGMKIKDKTEFLANFNIFFEQHLKTDIGQKEIDLIFKKFKDTKQENLEEAKREWIEDLINVINQNSPSSQDIELKKTNNQYKINSSTAASGTFDGFYFINNIKLTKEEKETLDKIDNLEDLYNFRHKLNSVSQIQISSTADHGIGIEKNSVLRHSLANTIIATTLNSYLINTDDNYILNSFLKKDRTLKENINIRGAIITAFNEEFPDFIEPLQDKYKDNPELIFNALQKDLTADPSKYIKYKLGTTSKLSDYDMSSYLNINNTEKELQKEHFLEIMAESEIKEKYPEFYGDLIFQHKSYFSVYFENGISQSRTLHRDLNFDNPLNNLENHEIVLLMQYSAIAKQKTAEGLDLSLSAVHEYFNQNGGLRGFSSQVNFNNQMFSNKNITIKDIDEFVFHNLLVSKNANKNTQFFINNTRNVYSAIINSYLEGDNLDKFVNESNGFNKQDILDKILKQENKRVFSIDSLSTIINQTKDKNMINYQSNQISEKDEIIILQNYEKIISKINMHQEFNAEIPKNDISYKLNEIFKHHNISPSDLNEDLGKIKESLNSIGIDLTNLDYKNEITNNYNLSQNQSISNDISFKENRHDIEKQKNQEKQNQQENLQHADYQDGGRGFKNNSRKNKI